MRGIPGIPDILGLKGDVGARARKCGRLKGSQLCDALASFLKARGLEPGACDSEAKMQVLQRRQVSSGLAQQMLAQSPRSEQMLALFGAHEI